MANRIVSLELSKSGKYGRLIAADACEAKGQAITATDVLAAIGKAAPKWPVPTGDAVVALAGTLNLLRVRPDAKAAVAESERLEPFTYERFDRIKNAFDVLAEELPGMMLRAHRAHAVANMRAERGTSSGTQVQPVSAADIGALQALSDLVCPTENDSKGAVQGIVGKFFYRERPARAADWHEPAVAIAMEIRDAWRHAGRKAVGWGKPTSPVVKFIEWALPVIGKAEQTKEAISKALIRWEKAQNNRNRCESLTLER